MRYLPDLPFPSYAFLPGQGTHPHHNPDHWSVNLDELESRQLTVENYRNHKVFLCGIDLFNHQFYWETHEVYELLWNQLGRKSQTAKFCQGMVLLGASGVKYKLNQVAPAEGHLKRARELFQSLDFPLFGVEKEQLIQVHPQREDQIILA